MASVLLLLLLLLSSDKHYSNQFRGRGWCIISKLAPQSHGCSGLVTQSLRREKRLRDSSKEWLHKLMASVESRPFFLVIDT